MGRGQMVGALQRQMTGSKGTERGGESLTSTSLGWCEVMSRRGLGLRAAW